MDPKEEEEHHHNPFLSSSSSSGGGNNQIPRFQFRKEVSKARWDEGLGMGEVVEKKGSLWTNTGIVRNGGRLYCFIEEILFLAERGALVLMDAMDSVLTLKDIHIKVAEGRNGCSWEMYIAYRRLKSLGYIVGHHGVSWTSKGETSHSNYTTNIAAIDALSESSAKEDGDELIEQFKGIHIDEVKPAFDVYLPDSKFKKSAPGNPNFILCMTRGYPPKRIEVEKLEQMCCGIPLKFCHVDHWLVTFVSFEKIVLPVLP